MNQMGNGLNCEGLSNTVVKHFNPFLWCSWWVNEIHPYAILNFVGHNIIHPLVWRLAGENLANEDFIFNQVCPFIWHNFIYNW